MSQSGRPVQIPFNHDPGVERLLGRGRAATAARVEAGSPHRWLARELAVLQALS